MRPRFLMFGLALVAGIGQAPAQDGRQLSYGRHLAEECATCHRNDGADNGIPPIAGLDAGRFAETLRFYQDGSRGNPVMVSVARSLNDEQVSALAAYYASLPKPGPKAAPKKKRGS